MAMAQQSNRRRFLKTTAAAGVGYWVAGGLQAKESKSANERIQFACIGINGKGRSDSAEASRHGDIVGICDIDDTSLQRAASGKAFQDAKKFHDFREMIDSMHGRIDAVTVSTPDHSHAVASLKAMKMGIHCFCQKPLTHSIFEAREMAKVATEKGLATQMGNQYSAHAGMRKAAAAVKAGQLGTVSEVHVWTNRPVWPQGGDRPAATAVPANVKWELFLGPAPYRPYAAGYHPFAWRGWWDFGTGALGDMACHTCNLPFRALDLKDPISVEATSAGHNRDSYPAWSVIDYHFPATDSRPAVKMVWYDGGKRPADKLFADPEFEGKTLEKSGVLFVGDKGKLYAGGDYAEKEHILAAGAQEVDAEYVRSPGHFVEWVAAIKGGDAPMSNFAEYAVPLTETILLGNLAIWAEKKVQWDAKNMKATNVADVGPILKYDYRDGYTL